MHLAVGGSVAALRQILRLRTRQARGCALVRAPRPEATDVGGHISVTANGFRRRAGRGSSRTSVRARIITPTSARSTNVTLELRSMTTPRTQARNLTHEFELMDRFVDPSLWIEAGVIVVIGALFLMLITRATGYLSKQPSFTPLAFRPVRLIIRWAVILVIAGLLLNKLFAIDLMNMIVGGLALIAIGVVAVWSMLSHTTATMLLILLRPFRIFDWITFPGEEVGGKVVDVNLFFTLLDNGEGEHFIIPNNVFFQKTIRHIPGRSEERIELHEQLERGEPAREGK